MVDALTALRARGGLLAAVLLFAADGRDAGDASGERALRATGETTLLVKPRAGCAGKLGEV